jgi:soluble lytic murein transglycosylase-like protein
MFPAVCRGRALDLCLFATVLTVAACASTGPGTAPPLAPPLAPLGSSARGPAAEIHTDVSFPRQARPARRESRPARPSRPAPVRRARVDSAAMELTVTKRLAQRPLAMALARRIRSPELADRVASAIVYEAGRARLSPSLLAGVLLIENAPFDTSAISTEGAIGLMQVMPVHVGSYRCLSGDLLNVEANICHGARLLSSYVRRGKSVEAGLRRYNGCVRGRNTPRCQHYPTRVLRTASRLRREMLASAAQLDPSILSPVLSPKISSSSLGADLPADVAQSDTASTPETNPCSTLMGCLRRRWSSTR